MNAKDFQFEIFKKAIKKDPSKNIVISPISLLFPLAILSKGAKGQTLAELQKVLNDSTNKNIYLENLNQIFTSIKDEQCLKIANAILTKVKLAPPPDAQSLDIKFDDLKNVEQINDWVKEKTENKITKIINNLNAATVMALLNAIYFHDGWVEEFEEKNTKSEKFYLSNNSTKKVNLMYHKFNQIKYFGNDNYQAINLLYKNSQISATIILPSKDNSINDFILNMSTGLFFSLFDGMNTKEVELYLPKIKLENSYELKDILTILGLKEAFQEKADFSSLTDVKPMFINNVYQKTFLEIEEKGTTASSATMAEMFLSAGGPTVMRCDRPYLIFLTKHCPAIKKHLILFSAKIENP